MLRYLFICNPNAGRRNSLKILDRALQYSGISYRIDTTQYKGHATIIANDQAAYFDCIVVVGGDGTLNEVINAKAVHTKIIGLIPAGSGNDFARSCGIPINDISRALDVVIQGQTKLIDLGVINEKYFINGLGFGLSEQANKLAIKYSLLLGGLKYYVGVLLALLFGSHIDITLQVDDARLSGPTLLLSIANGCFQGNGINVAPTASLSDGKLQIMHCEQVSLLKRFIGMYYFLKGKQHKMPKTTLIHSNQLSITSSGDIALQSDGELISLPGCITIQVLPQTINFIGIWK